ncbi:MAG: glutathione S-transferase domain-containing protein [Gammaproteobacteria bacterium]|nr:glutathione S-transferase domain-containing protein [Gammaproteobacteria bacterium]
MMMAQDAEQLATKHESLRGSLKTLEAQLGDGPLFAGDHFSLVDAALAPSLRTLELLENLYDIELLSLYPKLRAWLAALIARPSVQGARIPEFNTVFLAFMEGSGSRLNQLCRRQAPPAT